MNIVILPTDIHVYLASLLDVDEVVALEQTCRCIRNTLDSQYVWYNIVKSLPIDCAPEILPYESPLSFSSSRLRRIALQAVSRSRNWNSAHGPTLTREVALELPVDSTYFKASLLPGGKYVMVRRGGSLECWKLQPQTLIWGHKYGDNPASLTFAHELIDTEKVIVVAAAFEPTSCHLTISQLDLIHHHNKILDSFVFSKPPPASPTVIRIQVSGDHILACLSHVYDFIPNLHTILINWKSKSFVSLESPLSSCRERFRMSRLIKGYLFIFMNECATLSVVPTSSFDERWSTSLKWNEWQLVSVMDQLLNGVQHDFDLPRDRGETHPGFLTSAMAAPRVLSGSIAIGLALIHAPDQLGFILCEFKEATRTVKTLSHRVAPNAGLRVCDTLSVSGRVLGEMNSRVYALWEVDGPDRLQGGHNMNCVMRPMRVLEGSYTPLVMDPFSGAVTFMTENSVVIRYFD